MTLVSEAKMRASRMHRRADDEGDPRPVGQAAHDHDRDTPARTAIWNAPPRVPPMKAEVLKNSALTTLTSRTRPDDWRVNRVRPPSSCQGHCLLSPSATPRPGAGPGRPASA